jgi:hypothetical protein
MPTRFNPETSEEYFAGEINLPPEQHFKKIGFIVGTRFQFKNDVTAWTVLHFQLLNITKTSGQTVRLPSMWARQDNNLQERAFYDEEIELGLLKKL